MHDPATDGAPGQVVNGRYRLEAPIGRGATATVWRAQDLQLGREVALKLFPPALAADPAFSERFLREARAAARLSHPGIVAVHDAGSDAAGAWIVMELVEGGDMATLLGRRGPLSAAAAARVGRQVADALAAAHQLGIVHRDVKTSNLLLTRSGTVKLADLGIAHLEDGAGPLGTEPAGGTPGSIHALAPEQLRGEAATPASDIYGLGLALFELLTARRAFAGETAEAVARAKLSGQVPSPAVVRPDLPQELDAVVRWALSPDPLARPAAGDLAGALARIAEPPAPAPAPAPQPMAAPPAWAPPPAAPTERFSAVGVSAPPAPESGKRSTGPIAAIAGCGVLILAAVIVFLILTMGLGGGTPAPTPTPTASPAPTASAVPTAAPTATPAAAATPFPVPSLLGLRLRDVEALAAQQGFLLEVTYEETLDERPDVILDQDPLNPTPVYPGETVYLTVSARPATVTIPDLKFATEDELIDTLRGLGLKIGTRSNAYSGQVPEGRVTKTDPAAESQVAPGTLVAYWISRGPKPSPAASLPPTPAPTPSNRVAVGDYYCLTLDDAEVALLADDLTLGSVTTDPADQPFDGSWRVIGQQPAEGTLVKIGRKVDLIVQDPTNPC